jgi:ethanolamine transporter EutH
VPNPRNHWRGVFFSICARQFGLAKVIPKFWAFALAISLWASAWVIVFSGQMRGAVVIFRESSAQQRIEDEKKKRVMEEILKAIVYIFVGIIVAVSAALILHKFWPSTKP